MYSIDFGQERLKRASFNSKEDKSLWFYTIRKISKTASAWRFSVYLKYILDVWPIFKSIHLNLKPF